MATATKTKWALLGLLFVSPACCGTAAQIQPALDTAQLLEQAFVASGNPPAVQMAQFDVAQGTARAQFLTIYRAHLEHLISLGTVDPEIFSRLARMKK
jgi:hypothetical protein